jgi:DNA polymerase-3 subunit gamma/tau
MSDQPDKRASATGTSAGTSQAQGVAGYRVLARKYRPVTFDDLIGQEAMVRTVSNAFETGRIPQAWILTGVRGVGKTTTARILARALNYELPDGSVKGPTVAMPKLGVHDQAIMESRHLDVIEMDAASHNGVDDIRQINDTVRYAPLSARYKVYILDEVHMLTPQAFNALLKTLEEPPPHVKFIFATTEIRRVPVTVLSRCQRFDLRRIDAAMLVTHLQGIAARENIEAEPGALALIARAAEGSVRDALSLFDQAIAHSGASAGANNAAGPVRADDVRAMLGLADRVRIVDLFEALMKGDAAAALKELREQYEIGADPLVVLTDLADYSHFVTRVKVVPAVADDVSLSEAERVRGRAFATQLSMRVLSRVWQMLLKGIADVKDAPRPLSAAEMVLVRIAYAADLPTPDEAIRALGGEGATAAPAGQSVSSRQEVRQEIRQETRPQTRQEPPRQNYDAARAAPRSSTAPSPRPATEPAAQAAPIVALATFEQVIALAQEKRDLAIKAALERDVRLVRCEDGRLELALEPSAPKTLINDLSRKLSGWTGRRWMVVVSTEPGQPPVKVQNESREADLKRGVRADPLVQSVLARFPGAEIVGVTTRDEPPPAGPTDDDAE